MTRRAPLAIATVLFALLAVTSSPDLSAQASEVDESEIHVIGDIQVDGRATVGSWDCNVTDFSSDLALAPEIEDLSDLTPQTIEGAVTALTMSVSAAMNCDDGDDMDEYSREALEVEEYPTVDFDLEDYRITEVHATEADLDLRGALTISGTARAVTIPLTARLQGEGLEVSGAFELDMTDYDVDPPRMMLGTIRVRRDVEISFDLRVEER